MTQRARILIVDDEPRICDSLKSLLGSQGYDITTAPSGNQAKQLIAKHCFDIVLLDNMLPDMIGSQLIGEIKKKNPFTQAIIMTGNASIDSAVSALRKGAYDYLKKPFEAAELVKTVQNAESLLQLTIQNKLTDSQRHFQYLVDNSPDIIYTLDPEGCFTFINHSLENIVGLKSSDIIGRHYSKIVGKNNAEKCRWIINERRTGERARQWNELKLLKFNRNGTRQKKHLFAELQSVGMYGKQKKDDSRAYLGTHGVIRDITQKRLSEKKSRQVKARLQRAEKMEAMGTLASGVAHDLNNVLSGILGYPELILLDMHKEDPNREYIRQIQKSGEKASIIVKDLLTLARRGVKVSQVINMDSLIQDYFTSPEYLDLATRFPEIKFNINLNAGSLNIMGSPFHMSKCLMNLISNAAEAMPGGGKICVITQSCAMKKPDKKNSGIKKSRYIKLIISDSGIGIPRKNLKKIFDPFYTRKKMDRSGTGLGMTIVWTTVKDHNGFIDVKSREGKGTTFSLYFPVTRKQHKDEEVFRHDKIKGQGEKILVVDDMPDQQELASKMLTALGYEVTCVSTGRAAIEHITSTRTDLVLLDMVLGSRFDGLETFREIQKQAPDQKVFIVSGLSETSRIKKALTLGVRKHIKKPYTMKTIGLAINREFLSDKS